MTHSVKFAICTNVPFDGRHVEDESIKEHVIIFGVYDIMHIVAKLDNYWWIGRLVEEGSSLGYIPTPFMLQKYFQKEILRLRKTLNIKLRYNNSIECNFNINNSDVQKLKNKLALFKTSKMNDIKYYNIIPIMRPIIFIGPSLKRYDITKKLHIKIFELLKNYFGERIKIKHIHKKINICSTKTSLVNIPPKEELNSKKSEIKMAKVQQEIEEIYNLAKEMNLLLLDCEYINYPEQLSKTFLDSIFIYIKMKKDTFVALINHQQGPMTAHYTFKGMKQVYALMSLDSSYSSQDFDLTIEEYNLNAAFTTLCDFLESYLQATRPPLSTDVQQLLTPNRNSMEIFNLYQKTKNCTQFAVKNNHTETVYRSSGKKANDDDYERIDNEITVQSYHPKKRHDYDYKKQQLQYDVYRPTSKQFKYDNNKPENHETMIQSHHPKKRHDYNYKENSNSMSDVMPYVDKKHQHILHGQRKGRYVVSDLKESIL